jgi:hypothetical protein
MVKRQSLTPHLAGWLAAAGLAGGEPVELGAGLENAGVERDVAESRLPGT